MSKTLFKGILPVIIVFVFLVTMIPLTAGDAYAASNWESENNGTTEKANTISVNNTCYGTISDKYDYDYYWFTVPSNGVIQLTFNHEYISNPNEFWAINLFDEDRDVNKYYGVKGNVTSTTFAKIGVHAGTYYVRVSDSSLWSSTTYNFKAGFTASSVWETENNNSTYKADTISLGKRFYGNIYDKYESDYYWFHLSKRTKIKINFKHSIIKNPENYWNIMVRDTNWNVDKYYSIKGNKASTTYNVGYLPAGDYFVRVQNSSLWSQTTYSFMVYKNNNPNSTKITSISGGKQKISLKWKKSSDATGYEIYRSTKKSGTYKKIKIIKSRNTLKYTNSKLKKGKRYYYKIRAYKTVNGKKYYSGYSAVKSAKTK